MIISFSENGLKPAHNRCTEMSVKKPSCSSFSDNQRMLQDNLKGLLTKFFFSNPEKIVSVVRRFGKGTEALTEFTEENHFLVIYRKESIKRRVWTIIFKDSYFRLWGFLRAQW